MGITGESTVVPGSRVSGGLQARIICKCYCHWVPGSRVCKPVSATATGWALKCEMWIQRLSAMATGWALKCGCRG